MFKFAGWLADNSGDRRQAALRVAAAPGQAAAPEGHGRHGGDPSQNRRATSHAPHNLTIP